MITAIKVLVAVPLTLLVIGSVWLLWKSCSSRSPPEQRTPYDCLAVDGRVHAESIRCGGARQTTRPLINARNIALQSLNCAPCLALFVYLLLLQAVVDGLDSGPGRL